MSDEEDVVSGEEEEDTKSEEEEEEEEETTSPAKKMGPDDSGPSEAELAMQRRREQLVDVAGVDEQTMELLELARQEREREEQEIQIMRERIRRRQGASQMLDEDAEELLEANRQERARMEEEINELKARSQQRKKEREEQEKEMAERRAEEEARRKNEEEERKKKKNEEDEKRKAAREQKMAEFEKWKNPSKPNFVISKRDGPVGVMGDSQGGDDDSQGEKKSKEQLEAEKRAILAQRIQPLDISGFDVAKLTEKAKELHTLVYRLESDKYDLEKRFKDQQYDMMELADKARQMNQVGRGGLKRVQLGQDETDKIQERFAGAPAKIMMYSRFERQKDKRKYAERHDVFHGPTWVMPPDRITARKTIKWDENTGLPSYEYLPGMEEAEGEEGEE